jgi:hypothetical protein
MGRQYPLILAVLIAMTTLPAYGVAKRSATAVAQFKRQNPCPTNGARRGACPGYVVDHITPLCAGGPDTPSNMQWQTVAEGKVKDQWERKLCRKNVPLGSLRHPGT